MEKKIWEKNLNKKKQNHHFLGLIWTCIFKKLTNYEPISYIEKSQSKKIDISQKI